MKSTNRWRGAGNYNLRGKKEKLMNCGCCTIVDLRQKDIDNVHKREMRDIDYYLVKRIYIEEAEFYANYNK